MSRFLVYTAPAHGHVLPYVPGLLALRARGHDVHVRTLPALVDVLQGLGLEASPVSEAVLAVEVTDYKATTDNDRLKNGQIDLIERGRHDGPDLDDAIASFRPDVLLVDSIAYGAHMHAEASGLPRAILLPSVLPLPGKRIPPYGLGLRPMRGPVGAVRDAVLWRLVERLFTKAMATGLNELRREVGLAPISGPLELYTEGTTVIGTTSAPIEYERRDLPEHVHLVGSQPFDLPADRPAYLDEPGDPWVLVTCSTDYQGDEDLARIAVEALRDEPVRVLITLADAAETAELPAADNVRAEHFVPHGHVLPHCAAVVCHGGMGIVNNALHHGVPLAVVPFGRDQPEIARRVTETGAGVSVKAKKLTPEKLRDAVRQARALQPQAAAASQQMRHNSDPELFADAAAGLVRNGHRELV
jgi:MGT family glycosyltransferase